MILSALFFLGIIYCVERLKVIRKKESEIYDLKVEESYETTVPGGDTTLAKRWDSVKTHIESTNQNDCSLCGRGRGGYHRASSSAVHV